MDLTEHRVDGRELFKGHFLHALCDQVRLPDGRVAEREYVVHPGAVMVVPLLERAGCWRWCSSASTATPCSAR